MRRAPLAQTSASWAARAANLLGAVTNGRPVSSAIAAATRSPNSGWVLSPVPTAVPPGRQLVEAREGLLDPLEVGVELGHVAGELLAQREGDGVHQVGPADLGDPGEGLGLGGERVAQAPHRGQQARGQLLGGGDVHGRREGVVGGLRHVHVVVGMDRGLGTHHAAVELDGPVGDDLVGVHVGLGPAAGLPDAQREVVVELAVGHLAGRGWR